MLELDKKVFGSILVMEIIGSSPDSEELERRLKAELDIMLQDLNGRDREQLLKLQKRQNSVEKLMNSRPGSMAISQEKIRLFTDFSQRYLAEIEKRAADCS